MSKHMTPDAARQDRSRRVEQVGHEIATWSAELNRRLAADTIRGCMPWEETDE